MAFISGAVGTGGITSGTFSTTVTKSVTAGNTAVILVNLQNSASVMPVNTWLSTLTDNAAGGSNTYLPGPTAAGAFASMGSGGTGYGGWVQYCQTLKSTASITVSANFVLGANSSQFSSVVILEYSLLGTFEVAGATTGQYQPAATANAVTSGAATVSAGDTIIGVTIDWLGNGTITAGTGFTPDYNVAGVYMSESLTQGAGGSRAATFTASVATDGFVTGMLAFLPAGPAVAGPEALDRQIFRLRYPLWR